MIDAALRGALMVLLILLAGVLLRDRPRSPNRQLAIGLALGLAVQTAGLTPWVEAHVSLAGRAPLIAISVGNAVLFWLLIRSLVDDEFVLRRRHALVWLLVAVLVGLNCAFVLGSRTPVAPIAARLQEAVPTLFTLLSAIAASMHWRADLVERRRRLRGFIVVTGVIYSLAMMVERARSPHGRLSELAATLDVAFLLLIVAGISSQLLRLTGSEVFLPASTRAPQAPAAVAAPLPRAPLDGDVAATPPAVPDPADERLARALQRAMVEERAYRSEDLTVASLAARLAVPPYRLRRVINQRLGHRNFNAFVNAYRLDEACRALADPSRRELPILTIALEAGFQSIGPFNRAFKAATGRTPGEFRREKLADS